MGGTAAVRYLFTSESVTEGHPDKICDQISDAILDDVLTKDPYARVACETVVTTGLVLVVGEISCQCYVDIPTIVRNTVREIGYTRAKYGFEADTCGVMVALDEQSSDIGEAVGGADVEKAALAGDEQGVERIGAGDQGLMFGFAVNETPELMPLPISLSHRLTRKIAQLRKDKELTYLRPDAKAQVTVEYDENEQPTRVDAVVISTQHHPKVTYERLKDDMMERVIKEEIPAELLDEHTKYYINPTGRFVVGGPQGDAGLTGRKIIVDTYGGYARHGGGAFSGKDATK